MSNVIPFFYSIIFDNSPPSNRLCKDPETLCLELFLILHHKGHVECRLLMALAVFLLA